MEPAAPVDISSLAAVFGALAAVAIVACLGHLVMAVCLYVLARKTRTAGAWVAFVPLFNVIVLCRAAGKPLWWLVLLLVPGVNVFVFAAMWMGVANARGRSPLTGLLVLVPGLGIVFLIYLAAGAQPTTERDEAPGTASARCASCGALADSEDTFCGDCGQMLTAGPSGARRYARQVAPARAGGSGEAVPALAAVVLVVGFVGLAVVGWRYLGSPVSVLSDSEDERESRPPAVDAGADSRPTRNGWPTEEGLATSDRSVSAGAGGTGLAPSVPSWPNAALPESPAGVPSSFPQDPAGVAGESRNEPVAADGEFLEQIAEKLQAEIESESWIESAQGSTEVLIFPESDEIRTDGAQIRIFRAGQSDGE